MNVDTLLQALRHQHVNIDWVAFEGDAIEVVSDGIKDIGNQPMFDHWPYTVIRVSRNSATTLESTFVLPDRAPEQDSNQIDLVQLAKCGRTAGHFDPSHTCVVAWANSELWNGLPQSDDVDFAGFGLIFKGDRPTDFWRKTRALFDLGYVACREVQQSGFVAATYVRSEFVADFNEIGGHRRGRIAMSSLGTNGRFANQMFQYAYLYFYGLRHSLEVLCPEWDGNDLFGIQHHWVSNHGLPQIQFFAFDADDLALWELDNSPTDLDFWGYFQELPRCWKPHRELLRRRLSLTRRLTAPLDEWSARGTDEGRRPLIAIHLRRQDYLSLSKQGLPWYRPVPEDWYLSWLDQIWSALSDPVLYVATDDPANVLPLFGRFAPLSAMDAPAEIRVAPHVIDFEMLRNASHLGIANSSFSRMAAILSRDLQHCVRPDFDTGRLVPYEPWLDDDFWAKFTDTSRAEKSYGYDLAAIRRRSCLVRVQLAENRGLLTYQESQIASQESQIAAINCRNLSLAVELQTAKKELAALRTQLFRTVMHIIRSKLSPYRTKVATSISIFLPSLGSWSRRIIFRIVLCTIRTIDALVGRYSTRLRQTCHILEGLIITRQYRTFATTVVHIIRSKLSLRRTQVATTNLRFLATIIILAEAEGNALDRTISAVASQTLARLEVVIIRRPKAHGAKVSTTQIVNCVHDIVTDYKSRADAIARGIVAARGKYVCCLYAGDEIAPTYLEKCVAVLLDDTAAGMAYTRANHNGLEIDVRDFHTADPLLPIWIVPHGVFRRRLGRLAVKYMGPTYDPRTFWIRLAHLCGRGRMISENLVTIGLANRVEIDVIWREPNGFASGTRMGAHVGGTRRFEVLSAPRGVQLVDSCPHLLVVVPWLVIGGSETVLYDVLQRLSGTWKLTIVTTLKEIHTMTPRFEALTSEILHLANLMAPSSMPDFLFSLMRSRRTAAVLSSNSTLYYQWVVGLKAKIPALKTVDILHNDMSHGHFRSAVAVSAAIDRHIAVSYRVANSLMKEGIPKERITIIPNGIDANGRFNPDLIDRNELRLSFGLPNDAFVATFVGRLDNLKRPTAFLDIIEMVGRTTPIRGLIVGDGPLASEIHSTVRRGQLPITIFPKLDREQLRDIYAVSDVLVVTSTTEGMPLVVLEALAMECPVATTNVGDLARIIVDGQNGYLVPISDYLKLVPVICSLANDLNHRSAMRKAARASLLTAGMTVDAMVAGYDRLLHNLCYGTKSETSDSTSPQIE